MRFGQCMILRPLWKVVWEVEMLVQLVVDQCRWDYCRAMILFTI